MVRVIAFLAFLLALALGLTWIADRPGSVLITWLGNEYRLDILPALIFFLLASIAMATIWSLIRLVLRMPGLLAMSGRSRRKQKGYQAVARGMVAVSSGDARAASRHSSEAVKLLGEEPLALLLNAQAAQLSGDGGKAEKAFSTMLENRDTRVVGLRGLFIESQRKGDAQAARFYADEAYKLAPAAEWASDAALAFRCRERDWLGAMALVEQSASRRLIDKETARKQRAVLLTAEALDRNAREPDAALTAAREAIRLDPGLVPAAAFLGRRISEKGDFSRASKILEAAWSQQTHPDLADAYLDVRLGDSAHDRLKRAKNLLKLRPGEAEARLAVARAAIDAREFKTAREQLDMIVLERPTVRACMLMAELEEGETGNMGLVREWLARASRAERDKAWVADGQVSDAWAPISPVTGKLGGFTWTTPPQAPGSLLLEEMRAMPVSIEPPAKLAIDQTPQVPEAAPAVTTPVETSPANPSMPVIEAVPVPDNPGPPEDSPPKKRGWFS
ncbi:MAG: heme biosynthesis protein HemY [Methylocystis sp.]|nr:heme biosynthesis protein HemY [Methylocystis sp.]MCA3585276.1 heme biosynthesis protein HemY [Methylocystis sp.]MCA3589251.1 heme biosynthesis protein HemY [Methylocystis sp.]MCA3591625.1 heme biosynthesis protein HemY [Methylocystis sp.]